MKRRAKRLNVDGGRKWEKVNGRAGVKGDRSRGQEGTNTLQEGIKVWGTLGKLWKENAKSREIKRSVYDRMVIPKLIYFFETGSLGMKREGRLEYLTYV